jgi:hypothetical protein
MSSEQNRIISPVIGLSLIIVGALFLLGRWFNFGPVWPLFILAPGIMFLVVAARGGRSGAPMAIPGAIISGTGAILLYQSVTHHWESWAYAWTLYPAFLGAGMVLMGRLNGNEGPIYTGRRFIVIGLSAFAILGLLFETTIFSGIMSSLGWPLILLIVGVVLLLRGARHNRRTTLAYLEKPKRDLYADMLHCQDSATKARDGELVP